MAWRHRRHDAGAGACRRAWAVDDVRPQFAAVAGTRSTSAGYARRLPGDDPAPQRLASSGTSLARPPAASTGWHGEVVGRGAGGRPSGPPSSALHDARRRGSRRTCERRSARRAARACAGRTIWRAPARAELSMLHVAASTSTRPAASPRASIDTEGGAEQDRLDGGAPSCSRYGLAESLGDGPASAHRCAGSSSAAMARCQRSRRRHGAGGGGIARDRRPCRRRSPTRIELDAAAYPSGAWSWLAAFAPARLEARRMALYEDAVLAARTGISGEAVADARPGHPGLRRLDRRRRLRRRPARLRRRPRRPTEVAGMGRGRAPTPRCCGCVARLYGPRAESSLDYAERGMVGGGVVRRRPDLQLAAPAAGPRSAPALTRRQSGGVHWAGYGVAPPSGAATWRGQTPSGRPRLRQSAPSWGSADTVRDPCLTGRMA